MQTLEIPQGVRLADETSEINYRKAMDGELNEYGFKPLIVINANGPGKGKSRLARHILEVRFGSAQPIQAPVNPLKENTLGRLIPSLLERKYIFMDNVSRPVTSPLLAQLVVARKWMWTARGAQRLESAKVDLQVIITGNRVQLSAQLESLAIRIELA